MITFGKMIRRAAGPVVDLVLPDGCWAGGGDARVEFGLCVSARESVALLAAQPYCFHCGLTVGPFEKHDAVTPCGRCGQRERGVARIARVGTFSEPLITLVHRLKFGRSWEIAGVLAPLLYQAVTRACGESRARVDALVPVPLHWLRRAARGFNQSEELGRALAALSGWPVVHALRRRRRTREQARIEASTERSENLRGAFACRRAGARLAGKHVWLVDDVSTTGATLHAAASALRRLPRSQRPASINAAVVCIADHAAAPADGWQGSVPPLQN